MQTVRIGVLGVAHGHAGTYCDRWRQQPQLGVQMISGWDHDAARAERFGKRHQLELAASPQQLLGMKDVNAVLIAAETSRHADLVEQAAAAGKAIILQKPLSLTMDEADRIVNAVERHGVPFTLAWQMRVDHHNLKIRELLAGGRFGRVFMARRRHCLSTHLWADFDKSWHVQPGLNRDIFADDAAHPVDFLYWLLGMPESVTAEVGTLLNPKIPNDNGIAVFRYPGGQLAEVSCTFVAVAGENTCEILCENGMITGNCGDAVSCVVPRHPGVAQLKWYLKGDNTWTVSDLPDITGQEDRVAGLAAPLAEFLRGQRPPIATAREGRDVLRMTLACLDSAAEGRRIKLGTN
jgi:predicted dehydrogenase